MTKPKIYTMMFAEVYPLYVVKEQIMGCTQNEVDTIISWLTGYSHNDVQIIREKQTDFVTFFSQAPCLNPNRSLIKGVVCGVIVEDIDGPMMQALRYLDKLIDELAKRKKMEAILRN